MALHVDPQRHPQRKAGRGEGEEERHGHAALEDPPHAPLPAQRAALGGGAAHALARDPARVQHVLVVAEGGSQRVERLGLLRLRLRLALEHLDPAAEEHEELREVGRRPHRPVEAARAHREPRNLPARGVDRHALHRLAERRRQRPRRRAHVAAVRVEDGGVDLDALAVLRWTREGRRKIARRIARRIALRVAPACRGRSETSRGG